jgi:hypothetical protein
MVAHWEPLVAEIEGCIETSPTPGMRFAAGYGRAVLGAALAYVRAQKDELVRDVAEAGERPAEALALAGD